MISDEKSVADPPSKGALPLTSPTFPSFQGASTIPKVKSNDAAFPIRLHEMIEWVEYNYPDSIRPIYWLKNGRAFVIQDHDSLVKSVLPHFFKQVKVESFTRKLNRWGFRLIKYGPDKGAYMRKDFYRWELPLSITSMCRDKKRNRKTNDNSVKGDKDYQQVAKILRHNKKDKKMPPGERALRAMDSNTTDMIQFNYESTFPSDASSNYRNLGTAGGHTFQKNVANNIISQLRPISQNNTNLLNLALNQNLECKILEHNKKDKKMPPGERALRAMDSNTTDMIQFNYESTFPSDASSNYRNLGTAGGHTFQKNVANNIISQLRPISQNNTNLLNLPLNQNLECSSQTFPTELMNNLPARTEQVKCAVFDNSKMMGGDLNMVADPNSIVTNERNTSNSNNFARNMMMNGASRRFATSIDLSSFNPNISDGNTNEFNSSCFWSEDTISPLAVFATNTHLDINLGHVDDSCFGTVTSNRAYTENNITRFHSEDTISPLVGFASNSDLDINQVEGGYPGIVTSNMTNKENNGAGFYSEDTLSPLAVDAPNSDRDINLGQAKGNYPGTVKTKRTYNGNNTACFCSKDDIFFPLAAFASNSDLDNNQVEGRYPGIITSNMPYNENKTTNFSSGDMLSPLSVFAPDCNRDIRQGQVKDRCPGLVTENRLYKEKNTSGLYSYGHKRSSFEVIGHHHDQNIDQKHADTRYSGTVVGNTAYKINDGDIEKANVQEIDRDLRVFFARLEKSIWEDE